MSLLGHYDFSQASTVWEDTARTDAAEVDDPIAAVTDLSGSGFHLSQPTLGNRPLFKANVRNGLSAALFQKSSKDWLENHSLAATFTMQTEFSVIWVGQISDRTSQTWSLTESPAFFDFIGEYSQTYIPGNYFFWTFAIADHVSYQDSFLLEKPPTDADFEWKIHVCQGNRTVGHIPLYIGRRMTPGEQELFGTPSTDPLNRFYLGTFDANPVSPWYHDGHIGEFKIWNEFLEVADLEREAIEIAQKWDVPFKGSVRSRFPRSSNPFIFTP